MRGAAGISTKSPNRNPRTDPHRHPRSPLRFEAHCRQAARDRRVRAPAEVARGDPEHRHHAADRSERASLHGARGQGGGARFHLRRRRPAHRLGHARAGSDPAGPPRQRQGTGGLRPAADVPAQRVDRCAGTRPCAVLLLPQRLSLLPCLRADAGSVPGAPRHSRGGDQRRWRADARLPGRTARQRHCDHAEGHPGPGRLPRPALHRKDHARSASACCRKRSWWNGSPSSRGSHPRSRPRPSSRGNPGRPDDSRGAPS
jgi:hypothetical protein